MPQSILSIDWDFFFSGADEVAFSCYPCSWKCSEYYRDIEDWRYDQPAQRPTVDPHHQQPRDTDWRYHDSLYPITKDPHGLLVATDKIREQMKGCKVVVTECHGELYGLVDQGDEVLSLDAHNDCARLDGGFGHYQARAQAAGRPWREFISCGSWGTFARRVKKVRVRQRFTPELYLADGLLRPRRSELTRIYRAVEAQHYDLVFVCHSKPWTPRGWDNQFYSFITQLHDTTGGSIQFVGPHQEHLKKMVGKARARAK